MEPEPLTFQFLNRDDTEKLRRYYTGEELGWCRVGNNKCILPYGYAGNYCRFVRNAQVRKSDRWIVTFPRSGTTWIQELVWLLNNDLNFEEIKKTRIADRYFFLEFQMATKGFRLEDAGKSEVTNYSLPTAEKILDSMESPRFLKTHLPFDLLPVGLLDAGCKIIYVARNPKDVVVSYYHMLRVRTDVTYIGDFPSFWNFFRNDMHIWCPYWPHVKNAWSLRNNPNLLFLFYEDMKMDLPGVIRKVSKFYDRRCSEEEIANLAKYLDIESFKNNPMISSRKIDGVDIVQKDIFVRKGQIGGWKDLFTPELEAEANRWIEENLCDTDLVFPYVSSQ